MSAHPTLMFFCALPCEAKPLIEHYALKKHPITAPFSLYVNNDICLTLSGLGKVNMAAAIAFTLATFPATSTPVLLNIGIAGHRHQPLGKHFLANKIMDRQQSSLCFYPQWQGSTSAYEFLPLITLDEPSEEYNEQDMFDMEASAFYQIAVKFSTLELIHCIKIISDNAQHSTVQINAKQVSEWGSQNITAIANIAADLLSIRSQLLATEHPQLTEILKRYHFSTTTRQQLAQSLQRWHTLTDGKDIPLDQLNFNNGKQLLRWLNQQDLPFHL